MKGRPGCRATSSSSGGGSGGLWERHTPEHEEEGHGPDARDRAPCSLGDQRGGAYLDTAAPSEGGP